ncbi:hypothetical protein ACFL54_09655 [Planctomycetota bacterium]
MKRIIIILTCITLFSSVVFAGRVHLKNGQFIDGKVTRHGDNVVITRGGVTTELTRSEISEIEDIKTSWDVFTDEFENTNWQNKDEIIALIDLAQTQGLKYEIKSLYRKILAVDPMNPEANRALNRVKLRDKWVSQESYLTATGMVQDEEGNWITREEAALSNASIRHQEEVARRKEMIARLFKELSSKDQKISENAKKELETLEEDMPGITHKAVQAQDFFSSLDTDNISFDGKYITLVLRLTRVVLDPDWGGDFEYLWVILGNWGSIVCIQLPHQQFLEIRSTILVPAY